MRKNIFILALTIISLQGFSQEKGKVRVGIDGALAFPNLGLGGGGDLDIRYNVTDNINAGVKLGLAMMLKDLSLDDTGTSGEMTYGINTSFLVTGNYYFSKGTSIVAPYVGAGLGSFTLANIYAAYDGSTTSYTSSTVPELDNKFGGVLSAGLEIWKFKLALNYYLIPQSRRFNIVTESYDGYSKNSYLDFTVGFYVGGGKWKK